MANEIYNTSWWGNALETARTAGTDPDFFGSQMKLLTDEQPNLVTNGDFSNGSNNWNVQTGWSIANGIATVNHNATTAITQSLPSVKANSLYRVKLTISNYTQGLIQPQFYGQVITQFTGNGEHSFDVVATANAPTLYLYALSNPNFSIDDVSITLLRCDYDGVSGELVQNGSFNQIGSEEVSNGSFSQEGSELVRNGSFTGSSAEWTESGNWAYGNNNEVCIGNGTNQMLTQSGILTSGKFYTYSVDIISSTLSSQDIRVYMGGSDYITHTLNGGVETITGNTVSAGSNLVIRVTSANTSGILTIDNVSVAEVGQDWSFGTGWGMGDGKAVKESGVSSYLLQSMTLPTPNTYKVTFTVSDYVSGDVKWGFTSPTTSIFGTPRTANGTYTEYFSHDSNTIALRFRASSDFTGSIDNVSIKEVGQHWNYLNINFTGTDTFINTAQNGKIYKTFPTVVDALYRVSFTLNSGTWNIVASTNSHTGGTLEQTGTTTNSGSFTFKATTTSTYLLLYLIGATGTEGSINNVSLVRLEDHVEATKCLADWIHRFALEDLKY